MILVLNFDWQIGREVRMRALLRHCCIVILLVALLM